MLKKAYTNWLIIPKDWYWNEIIDRHWICDWFSFKERRAVVVYDLYENKYSVWLNEFWWENITGEEWEKIKDDREKQLDLTLVYLYPLLRDGKLKVKTKKLLKTKKDLKKELQNPLNDWWRQYFENSLQDSNWDWAWIYDTEYTKKESQKAIEDIKKKWLSIKDTRERVLRCLEYYLLYMKMNGIVKKTRLKRVNNLERFSQ